jgi:diguanylate cyclase (GGDEF)-like protein
MVNRPARDPNPFVFVTGIVAVLVLTAWLGFVARLWMAALAAFAVGVGLLYALYLQQREIQRQLQLHAQTAHNFHRELQRVQAQQDLHTADLNLLGRYGNLLLGCTDLAEALQISQQMLSMLLPGSAGSIYPLLDGEGLAEASHLWGIHAAETKAQAGAKDCWAMHRKRLHVSHLDSPGSVCPHIVAPELDEAVCAACIPLTAQGESLGWIYLSAPGIGPFPKLPVAIAAGEQLALALANLKLRQSLRDLSVRDPLTGLFNRRYLTESLGREMARSGRRKLPLAVMTFDLDRFKAFNDTYGHSAGDSVLVAFARLLRDRSRNEDIACRMGGEEFIVILPEMDRGVALRRAEELMGELAGLEIRHEGELLPPITTSIGIALYPEHGSKPEELLHKADLALYEAKAGGRNKAVVAS